MPRLIPKEEKLFRKELHLVIEQVIKNSEVGGKIYGGSWGGVEYTIIRTYQKIHSKARTTQPKGC